MREMFTHISRRIWHLFVTYIQNEKVGRNLSFTRLGAHVKLNLNSFQAVTFKMRPDGCNAIRRKLSPQFVRYILSNGPALSPPFGVPHRVSFCNHQPNERPRVFRPRARRSGRGNLPFLLLARAQAAPPRSDDSDGPRLRVRRQPVSTTRLAARAAPKWDGGREKEKERE